MKTKEKRIPERECKRKREKDYMSEKVKYKGGKYKVKQREWRGNGRKYIL